MVAIHVAADLTRADHVATVTGATVIMTNDGALMDDGALRGSFCGNADRGKAGERDETGSGEGEQLHGTSPAGCGSCWTPVTCVT